MAKVSKKNVSKKKAKSRGGAKESGPAAAGPGPEVIYDDGEGEEAAFNEAEENVTSEEDDGEGDGGADERKRQKLLEAISALGGKRRKKLGERSEAAVQMSEFTVNTEGEGDKVDLSDLIGTMEKTTAVSAKTRKQLMNLQENKKTVECPLSRQESERIQRDVAFQKAAVEVSRWKAVIKENQRAEQLVFPLNQEPLGPKPMERVVTGWKAQTPLEQEVFALLTANKQPVHDPVLTPAEKASLRAMSLEEAKIRRAELQKARALQSYYEAKARRERKIKSKKYHRVQNKAKRRELVRRFDEMAKADPAAALEELGKLELGRIRERMSLKHQNSGKWARSKAIMAKYDEGARRAMQQQLEVNKELTQKLATAVEEEEEGAEEEEAAKDGAELMPDFVNDAERGLDPSNPWLRGRLSEEPAEKEADAEPTAEGARAEEEVEEEEEEEEVETEEQALLRDFDSRRKLRQAREADPEPPAPAGGEEDPDPSDEEERELSEFSTLFRGVVDGCQDAQAQAEHPDPAAPLEEGLIRIRTVEDVELLDQEEPPAAEQGPPPPPAPAPAPAPDTPKPGKTKKRKRGIELKEVLTREAKVIQVPLAPTTEDAEDGGGEEEEEEEETLDQRGLISEAFAGDDVVADFLRDKRSQEEAGKPKAVDLTLPGWGEWGGTGLQPSRSKRRRFRTKAAAAAAPDPRKDRHLPAVIISERRGGGVGLHQVNSLPFPYENHAQFESAIRAPVGRTWNTERTVKKITKPRVVTRLGAVIEPMARAEPVQVQKLPPSGRKGADSAKRKRK